jgi:hypothetical protein
MTTDSPTYASAAVHHRVDLIGGKYNFERRGVTYITLDQLSLANKFAMPYHTFVSRRRKKVGAMTAYIAGASGDQNPRHLAPLRLLTLFGFMHLDVVADQ